MRTYGVVWLLGILSLLMLGVVYYLSDGFSYRPERYTEEIELGPGFETRSNPYLAAERFLEGQHIDSTRIERLEQALAVKAEGHALLLFDKDNSLTPVQVDALLQWVDQGGHFLLLGADSLRILDENGEYRDNLLSEFLGIYAYEDEDEAADIASSPLHIEDKAQPIALDIRKDTPLLWTEEPYHLWLGQGEATFLLQTSYGKGRVTVIADPDMWNNQRIGKQNNAWLLWYLVQDSTVGLLYDNRHDSLWRLLLRHFPLALSMIALLIAALLWHFMLRHGPVLAPADRSRRQLQEHLHASAEFQLHHGSQYPLIENLQQDILRRVKRRYPGFDRLPGEEQLARLARLSGQSLEQVTATLQAPDKQRKLSTVDFSRLIAALQSLRNAL